MTPEYSWWSFFNDFPKALKFLLCELCSMKLSETQIRDFQILYKNKYETSLSKEEAIEKATKIIALLKPIILPEDTTIS